MSWPAQLKNLDVDKVKTWQQIGDNYNEEWGVGTVHVKKIRGEWAYVEIRWSYHSGYIGLVMWNGQLM